MLTDHDDPDFEEARRSILRAFNRDPFEIWTRDELARSLGLPSSLTGRVMTDLASKGWVRRLPGADEEYTAAGEAS
jgi:DNA-binding IclR family transcriptional regulator